MVALAVIDGDAPPALTPHWAHSTLYAAAVTALLLVPLLALLRQRQRLPVQRVHGGGQQRNAGRLRRLAALLGAEEVPPVGHGTDPQQQPWQSGRGQHGAQPLHAYVSPTQVGGD